MFVRRRSAVRLRRGRQRNPLSQEQGAAATAWSSPIVSEVENDVSRRTLISITQVVIEAEQLTVPQIAAIAEAVKVIRSDGHSRVASSEDANTGLPQKPVENSSIRSTSDHREERNREELEAAVSRGASSGLLSRLNKVGTAVLRIAKDAVAELIVSLVTRWITHS